MFSTVFLFFPDFRASGEIVANLVNLGGMVLIQVSM